MKNILSRFSKQGEFDIRLWFVVISLVTIVAVNTISAFFLSKYVSEHLVDREGEVAQEFLNSIVSAEGSGLKLFEGPAPNPALQSFANHVNNLPGVVRANIYSPDFFIRYSTNANLVGRNSLTTRNSRMPSRRNLIPVSKSSTRRRPSPSTSLLTCPAARIHRGLYAGHRRGRSTWLQLSSSSQTECSPGCIISSISMIDPGLAAIGGLSLFVSLYGAIARGFAHYRKSEARNRWHGSALLRLGQMASAVAHSMRIPWLAFSRVRIR